VTPVGNAIQHTQNSPALLIRFSRKLHGFSLVEIVVVVAVIAIIATVSIPRIVGTTDSAERVSVENTAKQLNHAYSIYLAAGGTPAADLEGALAALNSNGNYSISAPANINSPDGELSLRFENQRFFYAHDGDVFEGNVPEIFDEVAIVMPTATVPLVLDVRASGGTATYGGQDLGAGPMPSFMLAGGNGSFRFHNTGGYDDIDLWYDLADFIADLPISEDRFNPTASKILTLTKDGARYDFNFIRWDAGQRLRLTSISLYN
jgi:prepilin-type N-terminal cleavage/methylation domain-containing protein